MKKKIKAMAKYGMKKKSTKSYMKAQTGGKKRTVISDTYDPSVEYAEGDKDYGRKENEALAAKKELMRKKAAATKAGYNTNRQKGGMMIEPSKEINFNSPNKMAKSGGLKGGQKKLDKNKDGKISGADFKMMKKGGARRAKRANRLLTKSRTKMGNAIDLYKEGEENKKSSSATAQEFGQDQQIRSKGKEKRAKKIKEKVKKIAKRKGLIYEGDDETGLYRKKGGVKKSYGGSTKMGGDMMQKSMGGMKTYKEGGVKNFKPHMMYDPKTGKSVKADTYAKHLELKKKGYGHSKTEKGMGGMKNYRS